LIKQLDAMGDVRFVGKIKFDSGDVLRFEARIHGEDAEQAAAHEARADEKDHSCDELSGDHQAE